MPSLWGVEALNCDPQPHHKFGRSLQFEAPLYKSFIRHCMQDHIILLLLLFVNRFMRC